MVAAIRDPVPEFVLVDNCVHDRTTFVNYLAAAEDIDPESFGGRWVFGWPYSELVEWPLHREQ